MAKHHHHKQQNKAKDKAHSFTMKICHWDYCRWCGLVALKNEPTERAMRQPCDGHE